MIRTLISVLSALLLATSLSLADTVAPDTINEHTDSGSTALLDAIRSKDLELVRSVIEQGADVNLAGASGYLATPLMYAASMPDPAILKYLIRKGADIDARDKMGDPAINWAAYYGHLEIVKALMQSGARTDLRGHGNAREIAMRRGFLDMERAILENENAIRELSAAEVGLTTAIQEGTATTIKPLLAGLNSNMLLNELHRPLLHVAASQGRDQYVDELIDVGADVDSLDDIRFTPLFEAARHGHISTARRLLKAGANVNHRASEHALSLTPLHLAAIGGSTEAVSLLLEHGAQIDALGRTGATPAFWAMQEGNFDVVVQLLENGSDPTIEVAENVSLLSIAPTLQNEALLKALAGYAEAQEN